MEFEIKPGKYRHFKGNEYEVIGLANHSETMEPMIVYRALYGEHGLWVRPASMWNETLSRDGKVFQRFAYVEEGIQLIIRKAEMADYENVRSFYHFMIEDMQEMTYKPGWEKDVYPSKEMLQEVIGNGELYMGFLGNEMAAAMVVNHEYNESYDQFEWPTKAEKNEITVIHALGVHPRFASQGLGSAMVQFAIGLAKENNQKVIRLDVLTGNIPAEKLYPKHGFLMLGAIPMFYEDTGWTEFKLYEKRL